jgi:hypothetical protein
VTQDLHENGLLRLLVPLVEEQLLQLTFAVQCC